MLIIVNPNDGLPIYRQIVRQIRHAVASGTLTPGDKLPSQRELARELVISHLTVKKAYEVLEADGLTRTARGRGTFVAEGSFRELKRESTGVLKKRAQELADAARLLGIKRGAFMRLIEKTWPTDEEQPR